MPGSPTPPSNIFSATSHGSGTITLQEPTYGTRDIKDHQVQFLHTDSDEYKMADSVEVDSYDIGIGVIRGNLDVEIKEIDKMHV